MALTIKAVNVGDYVYTKVAKYRITGADLVTNGQFTDGSTKGWTATDEANFPLTAVFGPSEEGGVAVQAGQTALTAGMYQAVKIEMGGTYVVSFKVKGAAAGYTDHDLTGSATNYINAYFNTDGTLGTKDGTTLLYGENGVGGGYQFSYNADDFVEVSFAVEAPQDGNIMIDFRGMAEGLIIKDVECHTAEEVYDDRLIEERLEYIRVFLRNPYFYDKAYYDDLNSSVMGMNDIIDFGWELSLEQMEMRMTELNAVWAQFAEANLSNVIELIPTTDGSANTGNNSANWMNWTGKYNKLTQYNGKAPWSWSTDRWAHKTAAANSPMQIQWMRGAAANNSWNNIATLTATLDPGTYYWGVTGQGGMMTLNKNRWARSWADECAETKLFFNGDTVLVGYLNAARNLDYVVKFELEEAKEITLGIICNNVSSSANAGFDVQFYNPVLYKVLDDVSTPEEFDTFPFTITASQTSDADGRYRYQSKVYNVAKPVTSLRFTFKDTFCPNGAGKGNPPYVALGEFYLYDGQGNQIYLSAENFYTNAQEESEGSLENLCDDNINTYWHSDWHGNVQEYHYLEVTLPEGLELTTFSFGWIDRGNRQNIPLEVEVSSVSNTDKLLFETIDNAKALNPYAGTDPGFYDADFTTFYEALAAAEALVDSGASEEELSAALAVLKAELEKVKALQMNLPVAGKSYRIVSAFSAFSEKQDVQKAIYANVDTTFWDFDEYGNEVGGIALWWGNADKDNSYQNFVFEPIENEEGDLLYYVRNVATGLYVNYVGWSFSYLDTIPEPVKLVPLGYGEFNLVSLRYDVEETYAVWHACDHNQGDLGAELDYNSTRGATSKIVGYPGGLNTPSSWYIREMSELPVTVPVSVVQFRSDMIHLYSNVNSLTLTADKECAFSDLQVYDLLGNVLPATVFVSGNTATVNLMDKVASFSFSFNSRERVREVIVNGGISQISMLREAYDAAVAVAPIKGDGIMQYANLDEYEAALAHAERLLASNPTDGEIMDAIVLLELAVANLVPNMPQADHLYYIVSAFDAFVENHGVNMMMYGSEEGEARWGYENISEFNRCWQFEPAQNEEGYYLRNAATGMYLGAENYVSSSLHMVASKEETVPYVISSLDGDVVAIASSANERNRLHAMGHEKGMGASGAICYWYDGVGTASAWRICDAEEYELDTQVYAMTAQDVVAQPSSFVNIPIELKNSTAVTAFQFDLYLPEDIATVYDVVLNGYRATDSHRVAYSEQPDGALRVLVYSIEDRPLVGNSGVVADVVVGISSEASEWDYPIVLSNVRMVKTDVTEVLGTDYMATLTIVQGALMGDVNSDGQHTMGDVVMIVNALLEKEQYNFNAAVADINGDGQLTIVDVVSVVRFVLGYEPVAAARDMHREASMVAIEAGSLMAGNHGEILLPIYMASDADYTAFQMDVVLPEGLTLADATLGGRGKSSHTLSWSTLDNGTTRIVAFAMDNAAFKDNAEALAILTLKAEGALQEGAVINLTDGLFATASGAEDRAEDVALKVEDETTGVGTLLGGIRVSGAEGAVVVESATDTVLSIYTMTGQLVQQAEVKAGKSLIALPAGVYVVNNQKVIVK